MFSFEDTLRLYEYAFPPELIAQAPARPRDAARLLIYRREETQADWSVFRDIGSFLPKNALLVLNETKVIPARMHLVRATGGNVPALFLGHALDCIRVLANRRLRPGEFLSLQGAMGFTVEKSAGKEWLLRPNFKDLEEVLSRLGHMPLPPYIKHSPLTPEELRREYQTVFACASGSVAAPTASLHFTHALLASLQASGIELAYVTLHVHLGTFAPLEEEQWRTASLHHEEYMIPDAARLSIERAKAAGRPVIAVGTTVVRTLESAADVRGKILRSSGTTDLFIREGYIFKMADGLITNFHVPKSSLLMLVSALVGRERLLELYAQAIERRFRLFSFGDAMLVL